MILKCDMCHFVILIICFCLIGIRVHVVPGPDGAGVRLGRGAAATRAAAHTAAAARRGARRACACHRSGEVRTHCEYFLCV